MKLGEKRNSKEVHFRNNRKKWKFGKKDDSKVRKRFHFAGIFPFNKTGSENNKKFHENLIFNKQQIITIKMEKNKIYYKYLR